MLGEACRTSDVERAVTVLDVFLAAYAAEPDAALVNRAPDDDLLTWGELRAILSHFADPEAVKENPHVG